MLPESYAYAFATLMSLSSVDVQLAGDVQQSPAFEDNLLTLVMREYYESPDGSLPSLPGCKAIIRAGNEVRRFNHPRAAISHRGCSNG